MQIRCYGQENLPERKWSGGVTKQLCIFPESSSVAERNFLFRVSSASVEQEYSLFSDFRWYRRKLMVLEGRIRLRFRRDRTTDFEPAVGEIVEFEGNTITESFGRCRDFNLIYSDLISDGRLIYLKRQLCTFHLSRRDRLLFYVFQGSLIVQTDEEENPAAFSEGQVVTVRANRNTEALRVRCEGVVPTAFVTLPNETNPVAPAPNQHEY